MKIAILEDDAAQAKLMTIWLESAEHECTIFATGQSFIGNVKKGEYELLILDWSLPDIDGDEVLNWVREILGWDIPVLFMTFRDASEDVAKILQLGADDFVSKSVEKKELLARINSLQRRANLNVNSTEPLLVGEFEFNAQEFKALRHGSEIKLTPKEFKLALYLFQNLDCLRSRADLLTNVWGRNAEITTRTVDLHISRVRNKLCLTPDNGWVLESVSSVGYRLVKLEEDPAEDKAS